MVQPFQFIYLCAHQAVERNSVRLMKLSKLHMQEGIVQVGGQNPRTTATGAFLRKDSKKVIGRIWYLLTDIAFFFLFFFLFFGYIVS